MGWAVGYDTEHRRHIGYGVPATCDQPGCGKDINRGLAYRCGDIGDLGCGLYFCLSHLEASFVRADEGNSVPVCDRCYFDDPPHDPTPETPKWAHHVLTDESWAKWRDENPDQVAALRSVDTPAHR